MLNQPNEPNQTSEPNTATRPATQSKQYERGMGLLFLFGAAAVLFVFFSRDEFVRLVWWFGSSLHFAASRRGWTETTAVSFVEGTGLHQ